MLEHKNNEAAPAGWQVTASTIACGIVNEYVTIMVHKDWSCKCTYWVKYVKNRSTETKKGLTVNDNPSKCQGPECKYVADYRDQLIKEEMSVS